MGDNENFISLNDTVWEIDNYEGEIYFPDLDLYPDLQEIYIDGKSIVFYKNANGTVPLNNVTALSLINCRLNELKFLASDKLTELDLRNNVLTSEYSSFPFPNLQYLDLRQNYLRNNYFVVQNQLDRLRILRLDSNSIDKLYINSPSLEKLTCTYNKVSDIVVNQEHNSLKFIDFNSNNIDSVSFRYFNNLDSIVLSNNRIRVIDNIATANKLKKVDLSGNKLLHLPTDIGNLEQLTDLNLSLNPLICLPYQIKSLKSLKKLDIRGTNITFLPSVFKYIGILSDNNCFNYGSFERIDFSNRNLTYFPAGIEDMSELTELNLGINQLITLPAEIGYLQNLTQLNLS